LKVTITFDNGPWPGVTEGVLDTLHERGIRSTFFVVGKQLRTARELSVRAASEGHWIGNHTMTHTVPFGDGADPVDEIESAQALIGDLAHSNKWFRPFGRGGVLDDRLLSDAAIAHLRANDYSCVLWNSVPRDWEDPDEWVDRATGDVRNNEWTVVVLHDLPTGAMTRLPRLLDALDAMGAEVVQDFPDACVPIQRGRITADLSPLASGT